MTQRLISLALNLLGATLLVWVAAHMLGIVGAV